MQSQSDSAVENNLEADAAPASVPEPISPPEPSALSEPSLLSEELQEIQELLESSELLEPPPLITAPGETLKRAREARGESLIDVARILKLSAHQLEALEDGRYDILPGPTFVRGFLRNYANYLGVPPEPLLEGINVRTPTAADLASMIKLDGNVQPAASPRPRSSIFPVLLIVLAVALALAGLAGVGAYLGWFELRFDSSPAEAPVRADPPKAPPPAASAPETSPMHAEPPETSPPPETAPTPEKAIQLKPQIIKLERPVPVNVMQEWAAEAAQRESEMMIVPVDLMGSGSDPASTASSASSRALAAAQTRPAPAVPSAPEVATLRLVFGASTLAQVRDSSGKLIFTRTGTKGSANSVKGKPPFSVMIRQANNMKLEFNGQAVDLKGHTGKDGVARLTLR